MRSHSELVVLLGGSLGLAWLASAWGCNAQRSPTMTPEPVSSRTSVALPDVAAQQPVELPGLHNLVAYGPGLISGSAPDGPAGYETLARMGIRTIISVDGALPDVAAAKAQNLRYVHLPIGYNGMDSQRTLEIARAAHDLKGPVYVHCHHGKHRSAAAAGAVAVTLGKLTCAAALARMEVSGTAPDYPGLFACVRAAAFANDEELKSASSDFPETMPPAGLVGTMLAADDTVERLKKIEKAGWQTPSDHPDLAPSAEAGQLADLFRGLALDGRAAERGSDFVERLRKASAVASALEERLQRRSADAQEASRLFAELANDCKSCHARFRD